MHEPHNHSLADITRGAFLSLIELAQRPKQALEEPLFKALLFEGQITQYGYLRHGEALAFPAHHPAFGPAHRGGNRGGGRRRARGGRVGRTCGGGRLRRGGTPPASRATRTSRSASRTTSRTRSARRGTTARPRRSPRRTRSCRIASTGPRTRMRPPRSSSWATSARASPRKPPDQSILCSVLSHVKHGRFDPWRPTRRGNPSSEINTIVHST